MCWKTRNLFLILAGSNFLSSNLESLVQVLSSNLGSLLQFQLRKFDWNLESLILLKSTEIIPRSLFGVRERREWAHRALEMRGAQAHPADFAENKMVRMRKK